MLEHKPKPHQTIRLVQPQRPAWLGFARLDQLYEGVDRDVAAFLEKHADLHWLLQRLHPQAEKYFGSGVRVLLRLSRVEESEEQQRLLALIHPQMTAVEAADALERFDENWWLAASIEEERVLVDVRPG